jgi:hypothetical protein
LVLNLFDGALVLIDYIKWAILAFVKKMFNVEAQLPYGKHDNTSNQQYQNVDGCETRHSNTGYFLNK